LVGEVTHSSLKKNAQQVNKDKLQRISPGLYPVGTAFTIRNSRRNNLITAHHKIIDNYAVSNWFITFSIDRNNDGSWNFTSCKLTPVKILDSDTENDLVILEADNCSFREEEMIPLCPLEEVPTVLDEQLFKTYYCAIGDCNFDTERPVLDIRVSDKKKMTCIKKTGQGRMWFDGGLCSGSSGGAVVDRQGRVVAMHTESLSDVKTVQQVQEARSGKKLEKDYMKRIDDISEAHDSSAHSYSSSQYCILLCLSAVVQKYTD
jgi:hypothetical protein